MRLGSHVISLLALKALSRSFVLSAEIGAPASNAADSEELPPTPRGVAVGGSSQEQGGDDRRDRGIDAASRVEGEDCCCWVGAKYKLDWHPNSREILREGGRALSGGMTSKRRWVLLL